MPYNCPAAVAVALLLLGVVAVSHGLSRLVAWMQRRGAPGAGGPADVLSAVVTVAIVSLGCAGMLGGMERLTGAAAPLVSQLAPLGR